MTLVGTTALLILILLLTPFIIAFGQRPWPADVWRLSGFTEILLALKPFVAGLEDPAGPG